MFKRALLAVVLLSFTLLAHAVAPFTLKDIRVEGVQRIEAGTVFSYLPLKVGDQVNDEKAAQAIRSLYDTGFFSDVRLEYDHDVLVVVVQERPAISKVEINGSKEFSKEQLQEALKSTGLAEGRIYDKSLLDKAEKELKRQYLSKGRYSAMVTSTVTPQERNRVSITFNINEGEVARIKEINIIGATVFKEKELLDQMQLSTPTWLSWYTKDDQYSRQKLSGDIESLRTWYQNHGYLEFAVDSTQVSISSDKRDIYITININEGKLYRISDVKMMGRFVVPEEELKSKILIKSGEIFNREKVNDSIKAISDRLADDGYSFANINANPDINKENMTAAFTFVVDPGRRVYVRRITISGNAHTRDEVIRREIRQMEGGWYSVAKVNRSKERIDRLGFFSEVTVDSPPVPGTTDQVDVNFHVVERQTGSIQLGAGYSSAEKVVLTASISQNNLFGSGNSLTLSVNSGSISRTYALSYFNPYWTDEGIGRSFSVYDRTMNTAALTGVSPYQTRTLGADVHFSIPLSETNSYSIGTGVESTSVTLSNNSPIQYLQFVNDFGDLVRTWKGDIGFSKDSRDSVLYPTKGLNQRYGLEVGLPGGDDRYYRATANAQWLLPVTRSSSLSFSGQLGYANGYNGLPLPFFKNFFAGGVGSVRGYYTSSLGPHSQDIVGNNLNLGGNRLITGSMEWLLPMPGSKNDKSVRIMPFVDAGNVYGVGEQVNLGLLRYSSGIGLAWYSPLGPLTFSYAFPMHTQPGDNIQRLQFQIGTNF